MTVLLQNSLAAAILILVIVVLRSLALHSLPKNTFCILWTAAALRLLLPASLESRYSIFTFLAALPKTGGGEPRLFVSTVSAKPAYMGAEAVVERPFPVFPVIWLTVGCLLAGFFLVSYLRSVRKFRRSAPVDGVELPKSLFPVQVRRAEGITGPLTYGILRPVILLPETTDWTDRNSLALVLAHEYAHVRRWDCLTKLLFLTALCVHWFNPAVWLLCWLGNRDLELACDESAIRSLGETRRFDYARTLLAQAEQAHGFLTLFSRFGASGVEERVVSALKYRRAPVRRTTAACLLAVVTLAVFGTSAAAHAPVESGPPAPTDVFPKETWVGLSFYSDDPTETYDGLKLSTLDGEPVVLTPGLGVSFLVNNQAAERGVVYGLLTAKDGQEIVLQADFRVTAEDPLAYSIGEVQFYYTERPVYTAFSHHN